MCFHKKVILLHRFNILLKQIIRIKRYMIKIITIIGARPQIIKSSAISRAIKENYKDDIDEVIVHTGQHYDTNMSEVFFTELSIPRPKYNLGVGSSKHGEQTAKMIEGIENILETEIGRASCRERV